MSREIGITITVDYTQGKTALKDFSRDLAKIDKQVQALKSKLSGVFSFSGKVQGQVTKQTKALTTEIKKQTSAQDSNTLSTKKNNRAQIKKSLAQRGAAAATHALTIQTIRSTVALKDFFVGSGDTASRFLGFRNALQVATGSLDSANKQMLFAIDTARDFKVNVEVMTRAYSKFVNAVTLSGTPLEKAQTQFRGISLATRVLNLDQQQTEGTFLALEQMISKGVVSMEELRRQLGQHIPGAVQLGAKAMGFATDEMQDFFKAVERGEVASSEFVSKFVNLLTRKTLPLLDQSLQKSSAAFADLGSSVTLLKANLGTALQPVFTGVAESLNKLVGLVARTTGTVSFLNEEFQKQRSVMIALGASNNEIAAAQAAHESQMKVFADTTERSTSVVAKMAIALTGLAVASPILSLLKKGVLLLLSPLARATAGIGLAVTALTSLRGIAFLAWVAVGKLTTGFNALTAAIARNPIGLALVGISAGIVAVIQNMNEQENKILDLIQAQRDMMTETGQSIQLLKDLANQYDETFGTKAGQDIKDLQGEITRLNTEYEKVGQSLLNAQKAATKFTSESSFLISDAEQSRLDAFRSRLDAIRITLGLYKFELAAAGRVFNNGLDKNIEKVDLLKGSLQGFARQMRSITVNLEGLRRGDSDIDLQITKRRIELEDKILDLRKKGTAASREEADFIEKNASAFLGMLREQDRLKKQRMGSSTGSAGMSLPQDDDAALKAFFDADAEAESQIFKRSEQLKQLAISFDTAAGAQLLYRDELEKLDVLEKNNLITETERIEKIKQLKVEILGMRVVTSDYFDTTVDMAQGMSNAFDEAVRGMEDSIIRFVQTGKFSMDSFVNSAIASITRLVLNQAFQSIFSEGGIGGGIRGGVIDLFSAKGNAFDGGNVVPFAKGGIVDKPTLFSFGGGAGVAGEAGTEAIMPLKRDEQGNLGVSGGGDITTIINIGDGASVDSRTADQIGQAAGAGVQQALARNG